MITDVSDFHQKERKGHQDVSENLFKLGE